MGSLEQYDDQSTVPTAAEPCSYPGCGMLTAYLPHPDGLGAGWRHVDPADEADSHVGYPMSRGSEQ